MDRRAIGSALVVAASFSTAALAAAMVAVLTEPPSTPWWGRLPHGVELEHPPVTASNDRATSKNVLATADVAVEGAAPGIALDSVEVGSTWEESRAKIRDLTTGDVRAYAIGDLLPHGSLLVGLSTAAADVMVADIELVRLTVGGASPSLVQSFRTALEARALSRTADLAPQYRAAIDEGVRLIGLGSAEVVQAQIDGLMELGDPAVEVLILHVGDPESVVPGPYVFGEGSSEPRCVGDVVIALLERITGQTFGDASKARGREREEIAAAWERWWGIDREE